MLFRSRGIFRRHGVEPGRFVMVGNSLKSDILPVIALGGVGVHVPYHLTWAAERVAEIPRAEGRFFRIGSLRELAGVLGLSLADEAETPREDAAEIDALLVERAEARKAKDFARADAIRAELDARGIVIEDTPQGARWSVRR